MGTRCPLSEKSQKIFGINLFFKVEEEFVPLCCGCSSHLNDNGNNNNRKVNYTPHKILKK